MILGKKEFIAALPRCGRLLALDVGTKTVGCAVSDIGRMIASPLQTIKRQKFSADADALIHLYESLDQMAGWVVGLPLALDGSHSPQTQKARHFALELSRRHPAPILLWDERLSTVSAQRLMTETADLSRQRRAAAVDKMAACYFLQGCLDALKVLPG